MPTSEQPTSNERRDYVRPNRAPPRKDRREALGVFCRCRFCDWQTLGGEGVTVPRACCAEGLQFDLDHGLTPDGDGTWHEVSEPTRAHETTSAAAIALESCHDRMAFALEEIAAHEHSGPCDKVCTKHLKQLASDALSASCTPEKASAVRDSIAPNKHCPTCDRWFWLDQFDGHKCKAENGTVSHGE